LEERQVKQLSLELGKASGISKEQKVFLTTLEETISQLQKVENTLGLVLRDLSNLEALNRSL